jgi:hypothetical protein
MIAREQRLVAGGDHVEGAVGLDVLDVQSVQAGELAQGRRAGRRARPVSPPGVACYLPPPETDEVP